MVKGSLFGFGFIRKEEGEEGKMRLEGGTRRGRARWGYGKKTPLYLDET